MNTDTAELLQQHVIDPEVCIRCNTCEATCPVGAVTHDSRNYVVDPDKCNHCMACVPPCPTGSIDHWLPVLRSKAYSLEEQFSWDELPQPQTEAALQQQRWELRPCWDSRPLPSSHANDSERGSRKAMAKGERRFRK